MAYDVSTLVAKVQRRLDDTEFDSTKILDFLNDEQREIFNSKRLPFMERSQDYTLTIGQNSIGSLPVLYQVPISLRITTMGKEYMLNYVDYEVIDQYFPNRDDAQETQTMPTYWWIFNGVISVYPKPDQAYTATLVYIKRPTELDDNSDVPELPEEFQEILVLGAWERALEHEDSFTEAQVVRQKKEDLKSDLLLRLTRRQFGSPRIMRTNRGGRRWR